MTIEIIQGDCVAELPKLRAESIDLVCTSPPYWGLRDYDLPPVIWDAEEGCEHQWVDDETRFGNMGGGDTNQKLRWSQDTRKNIKPRNFCSKCGAWRGSLGLEPTFQLYVKHIVQVMHEVHRVLKKTGSLYINLGDTYAVGVRNWNTAKPRPRDGPKSNNARGLLPDAIPTGLPAKCLVGIPERIMIAMIDDGWILRSKIVWFKPNHMPSSVKDRFSSSWEVIYFFVRSQRYFFDLDAVRVPLVVNSHASGNKERKLPPAHLKTGHRGTSISWTPKQFKQSDDSSLTKGGHTINLKGHSGYYDSDGELLVNPLGKNPGDVWEDVLRERTNMGGGQKAAYDAYMKWKRDNPEGTYEQFYYEADLSTERDDPKMGSATTKESFSYNLNKHLDMPNPSGKNPGDFWQINSHPHPFAHFAVYPEKLVEMPIKASCPAEVCSKCGKPRERLVKLGDWIKTNPNSGNTRPIQDSKYMDESGHNSSQLHKQIPGYSQKRETVGWSTCSCPPQSYRPGIVLDPFGGSGTTALVAARLGRDAIIIEQNPEYCEIARKRLSQWMGQERLSEVK